MNEDSLLGPFIHPGVMTKTSGQLHAPVVLRPGEELSGDH